MKISQAIIQNRNISVNSPELFIAKYKGHYIVVTTDHGKGPAKHDFLTRYEITVTDRRIRMALCVTEDFHTQKDAIREALKRTNLI